MFFGTFITPDVRLWFKPSRAGAACRSAEPYCMCERPGSRFDQMRRAGPGW